MSDSDNVWSHRYYMYCRGACETFASTGIEPYFGREEGDDTDDEEEEGAAGDAAERGAGKAAVSFEANLIKWERGGMQHKRAVIEGRVVNVKLMRS